MAEGVGNSNYLGYEVNYYKNSKGQVDYAIALGENDGMGIFYEYGEDGSLEKAIMNSQSDLCGKMMHATLFYEDGITLVDKDCDGTIEYEVEGEFHPLGYPEANS